MTGEPTDATTARSMRWHRWATALVYLACAFFAFRGWERALRPLGSDFTIYHDAAVVALAGEDPSTVEGFLYLPVFAVLAAPFALLPYPVAACLWMALSLALVLFCARRAARLAGDDHGGAPAFLAWLPLLCLLRLADSNLSNGQVNAFTLALLLLSLTALRSGRDTAAGAWVGLATAVKLVPGFLLLYFVLRRRPRAALVGAAVALALVTLLPLPLLGWRNNLRGLERWYEAVAAPYARGGAELVEAREYLPGQSLTAAGYRFLSAVPATSAGEEGPRANLFDLEPDRVRWIVRALLMLHLAVFALVVLSRLRSGNGGRSLEEGLALSTPLILAPLAHKAHLLWMLPGVTALFAWLAARPRAERPWPSSVLLATGLAAIALTSPALVGRWLSTRLLTYSVVFVGLELVWLALVWSLWSTRGERATRRPAPPGR